VLGDISKIRVIAFDCFGTVFDLKTAPRAEVQAYLRHIAEFSYSPLTLPTSWNNMPAHPDAREGIARLRKKFWVVTLSNGPLRTLMPMSVNAGIDWDAMIPLELVHAFKPKPEAYLTVPLVCGTYPDEVLMVTANERLGTYPHGDLEYARNCGMQSVLIRTEAIPTIGHLADLLGC
jgi:2-haloalkanoic acid dehalogenase type II